MGTDYVVTEDVGLALRCLNGFPGPYCKPMLEAIGDHGLWAGRDWLRWHVLQLCPLSCLHYV